MPIQFVGAASAAGTSVTLPSHQAGDLIVLFASRDGSNAAPTPPGIGETVIDAALGGVGSAAAAAAYKIAQSGSEVSGTWASANRVTVAIYRGVDPLDPIPTYSKNGNWSAVLNYPSLAFEVADASSWLLALGFHREESADLSTAPGDLITRLNAQGTDEVGVYDSNGGRTGWPSTNQSAGVTSAYVTLVLELKSLDGGAEPPSPNIVSNFDDVNPTRGGASMTVGATYGYQGNGGHLGNGTHQVTYFPTRPFNVEATPRTISALVKLRSGGTNLGGVAVSTGSGTNGFQAVIDARNSSGSSSSFQLRKNASTATLATFTTPNYIVPGIWYRIELILSNVAPYVTAKLYAHPGGELLQTLTSNDTTYLAPTLYPALHGYADVDFDNLESYLPVSGVTLSPSSAAHGQSAAELDLLQRHEIAPDSALHAHVADEANLTQTHVLEALSASHGQAAETPSITIASALDVQAATHGHVAGEPDIRQAHLIQVTDSEHAHDAEEVTLVEHRTLAVDGSVLSQSASSAEVIQAHELSVEGADHLHSAQGVSLSQSLSLTVASAAHGHEAQATSVTQRHLLEAEGASHSHEAAHVNLSQSLTLIVDAAEHAHSVEPVEVGQRHLLDVSDADHSMASGSPTVTQDHQLSVQDSRHELISPALSLSGAASLSVQSSVHEQQASALEITQAHELAVDAGSHAQSADLVGLIQAVTLEVANTSHATSSDEAKLISDTALTVDGSILLHAARVVELESASILSVDDTQHALSSDEAALVYASTLEVDSAHHSQFVDSVRFVALITTRPTLVRVRDNRSRLTNAAKDSVLTNQARITIMRFKGK